MDNFLKEIETSMEKRVNEQELTGIFKEHGFFKSYTLRMKISGKKIGEKAKKSKRSTTDVPFR